MDRRQGDKEKVKSMIILISGPSRLRSIMSSLKSLWVVWNQVQVGWILFQEIKSEFLEQYHPNLVLKE